METRARYTLVGLFTLAVIAAGFVFVYWLYNSGGLAGRTCANRAMSTIRCKAPKKTVFY